jgi:hypothetical protein
MRPLAPVVRANCSQNAHRRVQHAARLIVSSRTSPSKVKSFLAQLIFDDFIEEEVENFDRLVFTQGRDEPIEQSVSIVTSTLAGGRFPEAHTQTYRHSIGIRRGLTWGGLKGGQEISTLSGDRSLPGWGTNQEPIPNASRESGGWSSESTTANEAGRLGRGRSSRGE